MLFEDYLGPLLIAHIVFAFCCVGLSTHLCLWLRPLLSNVPLQSKKFRHRAVHRFAWMSALAWLLTMLSGLALYPSYKVRVRGEFLENPAAIVKNSLLQAEAAKRSRAQNEESRRFRSKTPGQLETQNTRSSNQAILSDTERNSALERGKSNSQKAEKIARWFDIKEHWAFLGLILSITLALVLTQNSNKKSHSFPGLPLWSLWSLSLLLALFSWSITLIGLLTASARSVLQL